MGREGETIKNKEVLKQKKEKWKTSSIQKIIDTWKKRIRKKMAQKYEENHKKTVWNSK